jgi:hypothetical protein
LLGPLDGTLRALCHALVKPGTFTAKRTKLRSDGSAPGGAAGDAEKIADIAPARALTGFSAGAIRNARCAAGSPWSLRRAIGNAAGFRGKLRRAIGAAFSIPRWQLRPAPTG